MYTISVINKFNNTTARVSVYTLRSTRYAEGQSIIIIINSR